MSLNVKIFMVVLVAATVLRFWATFDYRQHFEDEGIHVPSAISMGTYGTTKSLDWTHPQLSGVILYATISVFGDNPYGWRIRNVVFGTVSVLLVYLIAQQLYPLSMVPLLAAALLALDPFHIYFSRTTFMEIQVVFFFLLYLYFMLEYSERGRRTLPLAGVMMGLTMATKAYYAAAFPLVAAFAFYRLWKRGESPRILCADFIVNLLMLPGAVYVFSYFLWFGRGYTFSEFIRMRLDAFVQNQHYTAGIYTYGWYLKAGGAPWEWFLKPFVFGHRIFSDGETGRFLLEINNPLFRLMVLPAVCLSAFCAWQKRSERELLVPALFVACYALILLVNRPMFSYSSLVLLPFAYLALSKAFVSLAQRYNKEKPAAIVLLVCLFISGCYLFPLVAGFSIPTGVYQPVLSLAKIIGDP